MHEACHLPSGLLIVGSVTPYCLGEALRFSNAYMLVFTNSRIFQQKKIRVNYGVQNGVNYNNLCR